MDSKHYNAKQLVKLRQDLRLSQQQVANAVSVDRQTIYRVEAGRSTSYELLAQLCAYYKIPMHEILYSFPETVAA